jgi:hypothetical protein
MREREKEKKREREKETTLVPTEGRDLGTGHHLETVGFVMVAPAEVPRFARDEGGLFLSFSPSLLLSLLCHQFEEPPEHPDPVPQLLQIELLVG